LVTHFSTILVRYFYAECIIKNNIEVFISGYFELSLGKQKSFGEEAVGEQHFKWVTKYWRDD